MGEGGIRTHVVVFGSLIHLRPRQVRYQAALRPDKYCFSDSKTLSRAQPSPDGPKTGCTVPELCQNPIS